MRASKTPVLFLFSVALLASMVNSAMGKLPANFCLNGKDPKKMSTKDTLAEFVKGPCSPIAILPGYTGSKMRVVIDCPVFLEKNKEVADLCGWSSCSSWDVLIGKAPKSEYQIWVPDLTSPFSLFSFTGQSAKCFGSLFSLVFDPTATDLDSIFTSLPGLDITWYGNTPNTNKTSTCGNLAAENFIESPLVSILGYKTLREYIEYLGYQSGLSYQVVSYDWRKDIYTSDGVYKLNRTVRLLRDLTGKKVVIMGHSMGNMITLRTLNQMSQEDKDRNVALFHSVVPPFAGGAGGIRIAMGGDHTFEFFKGIGLLVEAQKPMIQSFSCYMNLYPGFSMELFKNEPWVQEIRDRAYYERTIKEETWQGQVFWENYYKNQSLLFKFFPSPLEQCSANFKGRSNGCKMLIEDLLEKNFVQIGNDTGRFRSDELVRLLKTYSMKNKWVDEYMALRNKSRIPWMDNPGVPVALAYMSHLPTVNGFVYKENPKPYTDKNEFVEPTEIQMTYGDDTVPNWSSLFGGLKWAYEFEHQNTAKTSANTTKYPIKLVELCSKYNNRNTIYDTNETDKRNTIKSNEYIGVQCSCMQDPKDQTGAKCDHGQAPNDPVFLDYLGEILKSNDFNPNFNDASFAKMTTEELDNLVTECPQLRSPRSHQDLLREYRNRTTEASS